MRVQALAVCPARCTLFKLLLLSPPPLLQGTMEDKIYDRQVTKQSLSFRVVDQQQIERHFTTTELAELYTFEPELLDETSGKKRKSATPLLPKVKKPKEKEGKNKKFFL